MRRGDRAQRLPFRIVVGFLFALFAAMAFAQTQESAARRRSQTSQQFHLLEATIEDVHTAIKEGQTTCTQLVQAYINRAKAYNNICTKLVRTDGKSVSPGQGAIRAGSPLRFPPDTVPISNILPNYAQYAGLPIELGRMEATRSDPSVHQQFGMVVGIPEAGQINALSTLNIRGERSVTCKGACDARPASGALPRECPAVCELFRQQPDALERAAELDGRYGSKPDLVALPMYCIAFSFKDAFDTKDMRSTAGADVAYAMDAAPADSTIVARLRARGAIIYAKANLAEYNGGGGNPGGATAHTSRELGAGSRSTWAGTACNPYDTARETGGSSSGSAASVSANLVGCSICEETGGSCRQPAWRNAIVGLVTTKGLMPYGGAIGVDPYVDRAGIQCRTVRDTALVLDALKDPERGYFDPADIYSALPKGLVSKTPYAAFTVDSARSTNADRPLLGTRIGIVREYMVKHTANDVTMSDQVDNEIKRVLRDRLGAEIVESFDPLYPDDPSIPNMTYNFQQALAEILPFHVPEYLQTMSADRLAFTVSGYDVRTRDYMVKAAEGDAPLSENLNLRRITSFPISGSFGFHIAQYLMRRRDERVKDWASLNANAKYSTQERLIAMKNWENTVDIRSPGITLRMKMRDVMRMVILKVMQQNELDVLVNPTITIPPARIGYATQPVINNRPTGRFPTSADVGIPEITVPAGFNRIVYEPAFVLNSRRDNYEVAANEKQRSLLDRALPVGISFWAGPGEEATLFRVASAYERATRHRLPPSAFGPLKGEP